MQDGGTERLRETGGKREGGGGGRVGARRREPAQLLNP